MKIIHILGFAILSIFINACGQKQVGKDKLQEELQTIRKQISELQQKEKEILAKIGTDESNSRIKSVEVASVEYDTFINELSIEGMVDAQSSTIATSSVPATVTQINVSLGQSVKEGQVLAVLDHSNLKQSRRELQQQYDFAKTLFEKQNRLWQSGVGTEVQYLSAKNQMEALEKSLSTLNTTILLYQIKAPISGTIEDLDLKVGQMAAPGMPYFKIVNLSKTKVVGDLSESYSGKIESGDDAMVYFPDLDQKMKCKVAFASKFIDPLNRTFRVEIPIEKNELKGIKPNMVAKLNIIEFTKANTIVVPSNCIQTTEKESFIMLAEGTGKNVKAKKQLIKVGVNNKNQSEVLEGLKVGDKIITNGFQELIDGQPLIISN